MEGSELSLPEQGVSQRGVSVAKNGSKEQKYLV